MQLRHARLGDAEHLADLATANDIQPNVRKNGREVVFSSNRAGGSGGQDIWRSMREKVGEPWSAAANLGGAVNTAAAETRPSLSWDGSQLLYGRAPGPEGMSDIYVSRASAEGRTADDAESSSASPTSRPALGSRRRADAVCVPETWL